MRLDHVPPDEAAAFDAAEATLPDPGTPFRVIVHTVLGTVHQKGFTDEASAKAFYAQANRRGVSIGALKVLPKGLRMVELQGPTGLTLTPAPAVAFPRPKVGE